MRDDHAVGFTTMFVQDDEVCDIVGFAGIDEFLHDVTSTVDALRVGEDETHFLCKLLETTAGVARGGDEDFGVVDTCTGVFVVDVGGGVFLSLVVLEFLCECSAFVPELGWYGFARGDGILDSLLPLKDLSVLALEGLFVEIFTSEAGLSANLVDQKGERKK